MHRLYDSYTTDWDYSLLELAEEISFGATTRPIALPEQNEHVEDETPALVTGWGNTQVRTMQCFSRFLFQIYRYIYCFSNILLED